MPGGGGVEWPAMNDVLTIVLGGGRGTPTVSAHPPALEARRADRRQVPADRHPAQQLPARRTGADLRADAVQLGVAQPARRADVPHGSVLRRLRRGARRRADARRRAVVSGHGRRRAPGRAPFPRRRRRVLPDSRRRSHLPHGLRGADRRAHRARRRHHDRRAADRRRRRARRWASSGSTRAARSSASRRSRRAERLAEMGSSAPPHSPGRPAHRPTSRSSPRWASTSSRATCSTTCSRAIAPWTSAARSSRTRSTRIACTRICIRGFWADVGTVRSFYDVNLMLTQPRRAVQLLPSDGGRSTRTRDSCRPRGCTTAASTRRSSPRARTSTRCEVTQSVVGLRIADPAAARRSRDRFCSARISTRTQHGDLPLGIGRDVVLDRVIVDKNARIGDGARLVNERGHRRTSTATATTSAAGSSSCRRAAW